MIELHPFQVDAIDDLTTAAANIHLIGNFERVRLLLQAPTGSGKTVIASRIIQNCVSNNKHVLFLAHRRELVNQCEKKLESFGVACGVILSGDAWDSSQLVNVASVQTLHSWAVRRKRVSFPRADLVVIDEAHHLNSSKTWQDIIAAYPKAMILGLTATPINKRGRGLGHFFDELVKCPPIGKLIEQNYLVPAKYFAPSSVDLSGLKIIAGDYAEGELEKRMDNIKLIGDICLNWSRYAQKRQTLVFASGVRHSIHIAEEFNRIGVIAAHIDGHTPKEERDETIKAFSEGRINVLCNCAVFTEGTDIPSASCLIFARPTKSLLLYLQVAGRVLRTFPDKKDAIILDHAGVVYEHGPIDQEWDWKLDYGKGDVRKESEKKFKLKKEITCHACKCVYWGRLDCPECHCKPQLKGRRIETYGEYLQALDEIANPKLDEKSWYLQLRGYARMKGRPEGSAYYRFWEKFGHKPPWSWKDIEPLEPTQEVLAWIRHRNIKWAMSQKNSSKREAVVSSAREIYND